MTWDILILTQPSRRDYLARLMDILAPQLGHAPVLHDPPWSHFSSDRGIAVTARLFEHRYSLGENRQRMVDASQADYISFVDDDDLVARDFVDQIAPLLDGVDVIGFKVACYEDGSFLAIADHSLKHGCWRRGGDHLLLRDLSYMQPIRRTLALRSRIEGGWGEDHRWADRLREIGCVKTEHYVDKVMYEYFYRSKKTEAARC